MVFKDNLAILLLILSSVQLIRCDENLGSKLKELDNDLDSEFCSLESNCLENNSTFKAIGYLKTYGYLPKEKSFNEITTIELSNALIHLQQFAGIERTGRLDQNVIQVMKRKRCNEPDLKSDNRNANPVIKKRQKRSALGSKKWVPYKISKPELPFNWLLSTDNTDSNATDSNTTEGNIGPQIESAAQIWMKVTNVKFRQLKDSDESYYQNIIFNTIKVISQDYEISEVERDTKFKVASNFKYRAFDVVLNSKAQHLTAILVHVLGHILGLVHTKDINSIMSPFYHNKTEPYLDRQDIVDIQLLYGPNPNTPESDILYGLNPKAGDREKTAPNLCLDSKIDSALEQSDGVWLLFKGKHYFEIGPRGQTLNSPRKIVWDFKNFTSNPIDASLSWNEIVFLFSGNEFWKYRNRKFITTRKISEAFDGIPDGPFDDVFRWNVNQKTYFFKGGQFWKYDNKKGKVSGGYPKKISEHWKGIPDSFDAAISSRIRNQTYFFKDTKYYRFDDINKKVVDNVIPPYPRETEIWFVKCRNTLFEKPLHFRPTPKYEPIPEGALPVETIVDGSSYWGGVLITIMVLSLLVVVVCGVIVAYLYFGVLKVVGTTAGAGAGVAAGAGAKAGAGVAARAAAPQVGGPKPTNDPKTTPKTTPNNTTPKNTTPRNNRLSMISPDIPDKTDTTESDTDETQPQISGATSPLKEPKSMTQSKDLGDSKSIRTKTTMGKATKK